MTPLLVSAVLTIGAASHQGRLPLDSVVWAGRLRTSSTTSGPDMPATAVHPLTGAFSAADILMVTVLRDLRETEILPGYPALEAYRARAEARPGFAKALADQLAPFAVNAPPEAG